jgi:two-component system phosphate regulon sensor histidine kinase PhoR
LNKQNEATAITVSSPLSYTYRMSFSLHVEPVNRKKTVLRQMGLIFGLSLLSIIIIVSLFFVTFRNWLRQRKLSEMKSDFINNITHEFHTPIAAIIVANKSLQNEKIVENRENIRPLTEVIQRQSDRLKILIGQVLDVVSVNKINLNKKEYSVHHLLEEILLDYRLNLADTNIKMSFNKQAVKDIADLDQFYFTTMLLNIFDNALKYNENEIKEITVTTLNEKNTLQIIITDNGIGMQEEVMKHIFDKFYRGRDQGSQKAKGLGLGLYYVKQCVDAHKWKIEVKSKPGEGSTFIITIPI